MKNGSEISALPMTFEQLNGWLEDDHLAAFNAFLFSAKRMATRPYTTKKIGADADQLEKVAKRALAADIKSAAAARKFFETWFVPKFVNGPDDLGLLTGYFEPELAASRTKSPIFSVPIYARPDDLIDLDDTNRPPSMDKSFMFGRQEKARIEPYFNRAEIHDGALDGRGLELFYVADLVDAFFIHIQGSAKLRLEDGSTARISYAAKSGHPYFAIGKTLIDRGHLTTDNVSMQTIRTWLKENPGEIRAVLDQNPSFIFFQEVVGIDEKLGPVAAANVNLSAYRSLACDHRLMTFGTPFWVTSDMTLPGMKDKYQALLICQDTGSAIVGAQRGDLYTGSGPLAAKVAGELKIPAQFIMLHPVNN